MPDLLEVLGMYRIPAREVEWGIGGAAHTVEAWMRALKAGQRATDYPTRRKIFGHV
jgi:hypothetical protein